MSNFRNLFVVRAIVLFSLGVVLICLTPNVNAANSQTLIRPDPLAIGIKKSETQPVSIRIEGAQEMYGIEFHLRFDPKVVQVQDADKDKKGVQIATAQWVADGFVAANQVDNKRGTIDYAVTLLNPAPALNGDGVVATIQFKAIGDGTSPLQVSHALLATRDAQEIQAEWQDGAIGVSALGQAPVVKSNSNSNKQSNNSNSKSESFALPLNLLLLGAAGIGVFAFAGALVVLLGIVLWRGRSRYGSR